MHNHFKIRNQMASTVTNMQLRSELGDDDQLLWEDVWDDNQLLKSELAGDR